MSLWHPSFEIISQKGTATTDTNGNASITFPVPFPTTPFIFIQAIDANAQGIVIDIVSRSNTGFSVKARKVTGITTGGAGGHSHTTGSAGDHSHSFTPSGSISSTDLGSPTSSTESAYKIVLYDVVLSACAAGHSSCVVSSKSLESVADSPHTHTVSIGSHSHTFTGSSGTTGSAGSHTHSVSSVGDHTHSVDAPVLSITFNWLAVV